MLEKFLIFIIGIKIYKGIVGLKLFLAFGILELFISRIFLVLVVIDRTAILENLKLTSSYSKNRTELCNFTNVRNSFSGKHDLFCPDQHFLISTCEFSWNKQPTLLTIRFLSKSRNCSFLLYYDIKGQARAEVD